MKSLRNKVILSAIVLGFALIATIGSTYAWFTVSNTVTVESMTLNVQASDSILIRVASSTPASDSNLDVATSYATTVTTADILTEWDYVSGNWKLSPVTAIQTGYATVNGKVLNSMVVSDANVMRTLVDASADKNDSSGKYIQVAFWLYSQSANPVNVVLQDLVIASDAGNITAQADVVNAVRLAIWGDDSIVEYGSPSDIVGSAYIYGMNNDYAYAFTDPNLPGYYDGVLDDPFTIGTSEFNQLSDLTTSILTELTNNGVSYWDGTADTTYSKAATNDATTIYALQPMTPTLVTVNIYVEGWNSYATNDIIAAAFQISFKFALKTA